MSYGIIRGIAHLWVIDQWVFRVLVAVADDDWLYLYIPANNYRFRYSDIVSWDADTFIWHAETRCVRFNLLQTGVKIQ